MIRVDDFADFERLLADFTNYERQRFPRFDDKTIRLERMKNLVARLGHPDRRYPSIHVAGSKGKGSTTLLVEAILEGEGLLTGAYTSPHVEHLRERVRVGGRDATEAQFVSAVRSILPVLEELEGQSGFPTFFELMTALAMELFAQETVDYGIFEVGLGGRLDATNVLLPRVAAITSIGLEHTRILGDTVEEIAAEKAGIIKPGVPIVVGRMPDAARAVIERIARERCAEVHRAFERPVDLAGPGRVSLPSGVAVDGPALAGPAARANLEVALTITRLALGREPDPVRLESSLRALRLPSRVEIHTGEPTVVVDGSHTEDSVRALRLALEELELRRPYIAVVSIAADKRLAAIIDELRLFVDEAIFTRADPARSAEPAELRDRFGSGTIVEDPSAAFSAAADRARWLATDGQRPTVVVCGSMYLAGRIRHALGSAASSS